MHFYGFLGCLTKAVDIFGRSIIEHTHTHTHTHKTTTIPLLCYSPRANNNEKHSSANPRCRSCNRHETLVNGQDSNNAQWDLKTEKKVEKK